MNSNFNLTEFCHGGGCGCKISSATLDILLKSRPTNFCDENLLVGYNYRDDASAYDLGNGMAILSTTDFFIPIVNDPFEFGQIAAVNAISDIYAMGGTPIMALAIFGWPIDLIPPEIGNLVIEGGRYACEQAGISLAGGHSIDCPEPIFGLAVTGTVKICNLKTNNNAKKGDKIYLTKPLGVGVLSTAQKVKKLKPEHERIAPEIMCQLNKVGTKLAEIQGVNSMTDVTGFGLGGHLIEICEASGLSAIINFDKVPIIPFVDEYIVKGCISGGAIRNFNSYGHKLNELTDFQKNILCDPQTSGGLLVMVNPDAEPEVLKVLQNSGMALISIGFLTDAVPSQPTIIII